MCVPFPRSRVEYIEPRRLNQDRYLGGLCLSSLPCRVGHAVPTALYRSVVPCRGYCWISQEELGCAGSCRAMFWGTDRSTPHLWRNGSDTALKSPPPGPTWLQPGSAILAATGLARSHLFNRWTDPRENSLPCQKRRTNQLGWRYDSPPTRGFTTTVFIQLMIYIFY